MERKIDFYFDFISPFSYLAYHRVPALAERFGYALDCHVVDLTEIRARAGNTGPRSTQQPFKFKYSRIDQKRWADRYGIPIKPPSGSHDSSWINRGVFFALDCGQVRAYLDRVWKKMRHDGRDIVEELFRREIATELGWPPDDFLAFTKSDESLSRYRASTQYAHERQVFGVPTMLIGEEMWWGNDRVDFLEEYLRKSATAAAPSSS